MQVTAQNVGQKLEEWDAQRQRNLRDLYGGPIDADSVLHNRGTDRMIADATKDRAKFRTPEETKKWNDLLGRLAIAERRAQPTAKDLSITFGRPEVQTQEMAERYGGTAKAALELLTQKLDDWLSAIGSFEAKDKTEQMLADMKSETLREIRTFVAPLVGK